MLLSNLNESLDEMPHGKMVVDVYKRDIGTGYESFVGQFFVGKMA